MNTSTFELQNFNVNDGLQSNEFNQNACFRNTGGEMFFGGPNGLNSFLPEKIQANTYKPRTVLTQLSVMNQTMRPGMEINDQVILKKSLLYTDELFFPGGIKTLPLRFLRCITQTRSAININTNWKVMISTGYLPLAI